jgi:predicted secreted protein
MLRPLLLLLILLKVSFGTCQDNTVIITNNITTIDIKVNEPVVLSFLACHSCGYNWSLEKVDTAQVKLISTTVKNAGGRNNMKGGSVYELWKFNIVTPGTFVLDFIYKRPWMKEVEKAYRVELRAH